MSAAKEKKDLTRRTAERLAAPDTLDIACADTANGGSLIDLAKTWDIRYSDLIAWIYIDEELRGAVESLPVLNGGFSGEYQPQFFLENLETSVDVNATDG